MLPIAMHGHEGASQRPAGARARPARGAHPARQAAVANSAAAASRLADVAALELLIVGCLPEPRSPGRRGGGATAQANRRPSR
jgi:hypothetical protein